MFKIIYYYDLHGNIPFKAVSFVTTNKNGRFLRKFLVLNALVYTETNNVKVIGKRTAKANVHLGKSVDVQL